MRTIARLVACSFVLLTATQAAAQTTFAGKCSQAKPDPMYVIPVGDHTNHAMTLSKVKCTWSAGEIAGVALKEEDDVVVSDVSGNTSHDHGYGAGKAANGDTYSVKFEGTTAMKNGAPTMATCTWSFTGGTGKLQGLTGKGTCAGTFDATGAAVFDITGDYKVGAAKAK